MRILFVTSNLLNAKNGGWQCSNRNFESIKELSSVIDTYHVVPNSTELNLKGIFMGIKNILGFYSGGINKNHIELIKKQISQKNYQVIFFDSSVYGRLVKEIKKDFPHIRLISFFHNVETDFIKKLVYSGSLFHIFRIPSCFLNEFLTTKWSDQLICLTEEDGRLIKKLYGKNEIAKIPISFKASEIENKHAKPSNENVLSILFVGSFFYANVQGIKWFIDNVKLPVNSRLLIVGKDMDRFSKYVANMENVEIHSNVDNLSEYYHRAHVVVCPLFYGGGMKVKVAEALMYGKKIIGTDLAFYGYKANQCRSMNQVSTAEEFIRCIEMLNPEEKYFEESVGHFNRYFSYTATLKLFREVLIKE